MIPCYYSHQDFAFTAKSVRMRKFSRERNQPLNKEALAGIMESNRERFSALERRAADVIEAITHINLNYKDCKGSGLRNRNSGTVAWAKVIA